MKTTAVAVIAALLSFAAGNVLVLAGAKMFVQYFYEARMVALAHIFTLGWVSLMIVGVLRQLAPVAFGLKLRYTAAIGAAVAVWIPSLIAMVFGFASLNYELAGVATSVLLASIAVITVVFLLGFRGIRREPPHNHLLASLLYFDAAAILGAWMGLAKGWDIALPAVFPRVLFAHIHFAGAGWAGMMILAVMSRLFPQPHLRHPVQARIRFLAFNIGLIGLAVGLLSNGSWYPLFGFVLAMACIWYAVAFVPVLREFAPQADRSTTFLVASWYCLAGDALLGLWFLVASPASALLVQLQFVYGFVYLFGWLSFMILGMLYRIVPTHISKLFTARGISLPAGMRRSFVSPKLQTAVFISLLSGLSVTSAGILIQSVGVFRFGWSIWLTGILLFIGGLWRLGIDVRRAFRSARSSSGP